MRRVFLIFRLNEIFRFAGERADTPDGGYPATHTHTPGTLTPFSPFDKWPITRACVRARIIRAHTRIHVHAVQVCRLRYGLGMPFIRIRVLYKGIEGCGLWAWAGHSLFRTKAANSRQRRKYNPRNKTSTCVGAPVACVGVTVFRAKIRIFPVEFGPIGDKMKTRGNLSCIKINCSIM